MSEAETMIREARVNLAFLERFAEAMSSTSEGRVYLSLIHDMAGDGIAWALAHCHTDEVAA